MHKSDNMDTNKCKCKCFVCEKDMEYHGPSTSAAVYHGGTVQISFGYGSRKYDCICYCEPIESCETVDLFDNGLMVPVVKSSDDLQPKQQVLQNGSRPERLACCPNIVGYICDECFEKKSHLVGGWTYNKNTERCDINTVPLE